MREPPAVLFLNPTGVGDWGGVERDMLLTARGLSGRGHRVAAAGRRDGRFLNRMEEAGVPVLGLCLRRDFGLVDALRLRAFLRPLGRSVVLTKLNRGIRTAGLARLLGSGAALVQHQGLFEMKAGLRHRLCLNLVDRIQTPAFTVRERIVEGGFFPEDRVDWIPNGVDVDWFVPAEDAVAARDRFGLPPGPLVANSARLHDQKAHEVLLLALADLPGVQLALAGDGKREATVRECARSAGVADRVHFLGHVEDVAELLRAADVFCLSSHEEGMPNAVLEAMATGLPVVATNVGDIGLMLEDGEAGLLVPPDDASALGAALGRVLEDRDLAARLGRRARDRAVSRYSLDRAIEGVAASLARALSLDGEPGHFKGRRRTLTPGGVESLTGPKILDHTS